MVTYWSSTVWESRLVSQSVSRRLLLNHLLSVSSHLCFYHIVVADYFVITLSSHPFVTLLLLHLIHPVVSYWIKIKNINQCHPVPLPWVVPAVDLCYYYIYNVNSLLNLYLIASFLMYLWKDGFRSLLFLKIIKLLIKSFIFFSTYSIRLHYVYVNKRGS